MSPVLTAMTNPVSILLESYCNTVVEAGMYPSLLGFNSLRVLLQLGLWYKMGQKPGSVSILLESYCNVRS